MLPADRFQNTITALLNSRQTLNTSLSKSAASRRAREYAVQGFYLVAVRSFESFLQDQIEGLACKAFGWKSRTHDGIKLKLKVRLKETRPKLIRKIIMGRGRSDYVEYLPYENTLKISALLFHGGQPFASLPNDDLVFLKRCQKVRNYIAHDSSAAYESFYNAYRGIKQIRIAKPRAIHYLDDDIRADVTFFEHDLGHLVTISKFLS